MKQVTHIESLQDLLEVSKNIDNPVDGQSSPYMNPRTNKLVVDLRKNEVSIDSQNGDFSISEGITVKSILDDLFKMHGINADVKKPLQRKRGNK